MRAAAAFDFFDELARVVVALADAGPFMCVINAAIKSASASSPAVFALAFAAAALPRSGDDFLVFVFEAAFAVRAWCFAVARLVDDLAEAFADGVFASFLDAVVVVAGLTGAVPADDAFADAPLAAAAFAAVVVIASAVVALVEGTFVAGALVEVSVVVVAVLVDAAGAAVADEAALVAFVADGVEDVAVAGGTLGRAAVAEFNIDAPA